MKLNLNDAETQADFGELIPDNTIAPLQMNIKPGNAGDDGWATQSKTSAAVYLACEFTVLDGPHAKRKFWVNMTVEGETEGQKRAVDITRSRLRGMIESAHGIMPSDESESARKARNVDVEDLDGLRFVGRIGIEKPKEGSGYDPKNTLKAAVTPDSKDWRRIEQVPKERRMFTHNIKGGTSIATKPSLPTNW